ncbi:hypothetical protein GG804_14065 [Sphingomonas histidinilytica]|uniref:hypothetical protein n=1 Tax=Rhizorhabdus histidinilytica TaxID=439228 RepID=UPI001ADBB3F8|nr:hypothetical protein [Rhizorhabdus histidinilytica]MBO9377895.1 hypothetical protein [Rhizorhabdus histidinilytica]
MAKAIPPELCARIKRLSATYTQEVIAELTGVSISSVQNLKRRNFEPRQIGRQRKPLPADFRVQCNHMSIPEMLTHYSVSQETLHGWLAQVDRHYTPKPHPDYSAPLLPREKIASTIARVGITRAARELGLSDNTLRKMRVRHGMVVKRRRSPRRVAA